MAEGYRVVCRSCGWTKGPFTGTVWKTPRQHANAVKGGHRAHHAEHEVKVVKCDAL